MMALLRSVDEWISPDVDLENFYTFIWNIQREGGASGYGLDVWGRIVNVSRVLSIGAGSYFGFGEAGDRMGFDQAPFYDGQPTTQNYTLTDDVYRLLIFAKAALNITDGSIPAINAIMMSLFPGRGNAYVQDGAQGFDIVPWGFGEAGDRAPFGGGTFIDYYFWRPPFGFGEAGDRMGFDLGPFGDYLPAPPSFGGMDMVYVFDFALEPFELAIVTQSGVLPKPVGVKATVLQVV